MKRVLSLIQLPFPHLSYFPEQEYFKKMETWFKEKVSQSCNIPSSGIWEIPMWITWVRAAILGFAEDSSTEINVNIVDLNDHTFDVDSITSILNENKADIYFFSPLLQNFTMCKKISSILRNQNSKTVIGGVCADLSNSDEFDYIYEGRIEGKYRKFQNWLSSVLDVPKKKLKLNNHSFEKHISYDWAVERYSKNVIYLRTFSNHGCPLKCTFCFDRVSGISPLEHSFIEQEINNYNALFPNNDVLYIGDLTFGVSKVSMDNLKKVLSKVNSSRLSPYKLIVQTNASLLTNSFISYLKEIGVVSIEIGIESGNRQSVERTLKKRPSTAWLEEKMNKVINSGIHLSGNIIIGLPEDNEEDYMITMDFIEKWKSKIWFNIYGFVPYPKTPIFEKLVNDNRILNWDFSQWCEGKDFVFEPYYIDRNRAYDFFRKAVKLI